MDVSTLNAKQAAKAVSLFNAKYFEMEQALYCLSKHCRGDLLKGNSSGVVEALVWTIKSWWGVQGVRFETKALAAQALSKMIWIQDHFEETSNIHPNAEEFAYERVSELVSAMVNLGVSRQEFSLSSKILHCLSPWQIPVYDSFVRKSIGIPTTWNHHEAYLKIIHWQFSAIGKLSEEGVIWTGDIVPKSPLRALDKYMWWLGGGSEGKAVVVREPWKIINQLGIVPS